MGKVISGLQSAGTAAAEAKSEGAEHDAAFSWSELAKTAAMGGFSGGVLGTGATAVYHANHPGGANASTLTPEDIAAYNAAEQERRDPAGRGPHRSPA